MSDILSVALTRYADSCPPTLHSDCPFALSEGSERACGQECRDEVIRLRRPGHTRLTGHPGVLFDARQRLLSESGRVPEAGWHTASLILRLEEALGTAPRLSDGTYHLLRAIEITNSLAYLGQRGIDGDWLVRFGLSWQLPIRLALWIGDHYLSRQDHEEDLTGGWLDIVASFLGPETEFLGLGPWLAAAGSSGFRTFVEGWVKQAPLEDVCGWRPAAIDRSLVVADDGKAQWIADRFGRTYLAEWADDSLHFELKYLRGLVDAPIPMPEMRRREVPLASLTAEIADRTVMTPRSHTADVIWQALQFLSEGRRREAAALFDATRIIEPRDAEAHNNYGFCLTPDAPREALEALKLAAELEEAPNPVNRINQAVALRLLGQPEDALLLAEEAFLHASTGVGNAWLWRHAGDPEAATVVEVDVNEYIAELGRTLALDTEDSARAEVWASRMANRGSNRE